MKKAGSSTKPHKMLDFALRDSPENALPVLLFIGKQSMPTVNADREAPPI